MSTEAFTHDVFPSDIVRTNNASGERRSPLIAPILSKGERALVESHRLVYANLEMAFWAYILQCGR